MYIISKQFHFSASHVLDLPSNHPCSTLHGHNYIVELILASEELDDHGFVIDYYELNPFKQIIDSEFDQRHLNDVVDFQPSAENLACYLYKRAKTLWKQTIAVRVSETPKLWAEYKE